LLACLLFTGAAAQTPCLPGWTYRVPVAVDNRGGAVPLGGHQVLVVVNTQALVAQHKAKADGSDIRFLDKAGTVLPYWIENGTYNTTQTRLWVKVGAIPAGVSEPVYLFYGAPGAFAVADGTQTFELFDDFGGPALNPDCWTACGGGTAALSGGALSLNAPAGTRISVTSIADYAAPLVAEMRVNSLGGPAVYLAQLNGADRQGYGIYYDLVTGVPVVRMQLFSAATGCLSHADQTVVTAASAGATAGVWQFARPATGRQEYRWPGTLTTQARTDATYALQATSRVSFGVAESGGNVQLDWVRMRKYLAVEPVTSLGAETVSVTNATTSNNGPLCTGQTLQLSATAIAGATYAWTAPDGTTYAGQNVFIPAVTAAGGTYSCVIATPAGGCPSLTVFTTVVVNEPTVGGTLAGAAGVCSSPAATGTLTLQGHLGNVLRWESSSGGAAPWNSIAHTGTSLTYSGLVQTTWYRAVVQNGSCAPAASAPAKVTVFPAPRAGTVLGGTSGCSGANGGTLTLTNYQGEVVRWEASPDGSIGWTPIAHTAPQLAYSNLTATTYYRAVVGSGVCPPVHTAPVAVVVQPPPAVNFAASAACAGQSTAFTNGTAVPAGTTATYTWDFGDGTGAVLPHPVHTFPAAGTYQVTLTVTTHRGCVASLTKAVVVNPPPSVDFAQANVCLGSPMSFNNLTTISAGTIAGYRWNFGDGTGTSTLKDPVYTYARAGTYQVTLTATSSATPACAATITRTVTVFTASSVDFAAAPACFGEQTTFTNKTYNAAGGLTYAWDFGDGATSTDVNPAHAYAAPGVYQVRLTASTAANCSNAVVRQVTVHPSPVAAFTAADVCLQAPVLLVNQSVTGNETVAYQWTFGDGSSSAEASPSHVYATAGVYQVVLTVTTATGCRSTAARTVRVHALPEARFTFGNGCQGDPIAFNNLSAIAAGGLAYAWDFGDGSTSTQINPSHPYAVASTYTVRLTATSGSGCQDVLEKTVAIHERPVVNFSAAAVCDGKTTVFANLTAAPASTAYNWDFGDGTSSTVASPVKQYLNPGRYTVTLRATTASGCGAGATQTVTVHAMPVASFRAADVCEGEAVRVENRSAIPAGSLTYQWDMGDGTTSVVPAPVHRYARPGTYTITLRVTSDAGCRDSLTRYVTVHQLPVAEAGPDVTASKGFGVRLQAAGGVQYRWAPVDGLSDPDAAAPIARPAATTTYTVTVTSATGCTSIDEVTVTVQQDYKLIASNVLTPDGNGVNDTWHIFNIETYGTCNVRVVDRWGKQVYRQDNYQNDWQGTSGRDVLPDGTYYYIITFRDSREVYKGALTILRNQ
jgi:gliding motility-associated-like protein